MPTHTETQQFLREYEKLSARRRAAFREAVETFIADLGTRKFRPSLRVKGVKGMPGVFEMTWANDGRALFTYGDNIRRGDVHIVWLAVGTHDIFQ